MKYLKFSFLVLFGILFIYSPVFTQTPDWLWAKNTNSVGAETCRGVVTDYNNNVYVIGSFSGSATFGSFTLVSAGLSDVFLVKYDKWGNVIWAVKGGGSGNDQGKALTTDRYGNVYITGSYDNAATFGNISVTAKGSSDIFMAKYSSSGAIVWLNSMGGLHYDEGTSITVDSSNNIVIAASFVSSIDIGTKTVKSDGSSSFIIAKFDTSSNLIWVYNPTKGAFHSISAIKTDYTGEIYAAGQFSDTIVFDSVMLISQGQTDALLLKICGSGTFHWAKAGKGIRQGFANGLSITDAGDIVFTGAYAGSINFNGRVLNSVSNDFVDMFLVKYDSYGDIYWAKTAGGYNNDQGISVYIDLQNNIYVTGFYNLTASFDGFTSTSKGGCDIFVVKYNSDGTPQWVKAVGDIDYDCGYGITSGPNNNIIVVGSFVGNCKFGNIALNSNFSSIDGFVAALGVPAPPSIVIITQPVGNQVCYGDYVSFHVYASGTNIKYQWKRDNNPIPNADSTSLDIQGAKFIDAGTYSCDLFDSTCLVTTNNAILTVDSAPVFLTQPVSITIKVGETASFYVSSTAENYQWFKNNTLIPNASLSSYSISSVKYSDSGTYFCAIYNDCGDTISNLAKLIVSPGNSINDRSSLNEINIYPNPADQRLYLDFNELIKSGKIQMINIQGVIIYESIISNEKTKEIDISNINEGIYFVKVIYRNTISLEKIIIKRRNDQ